MNLFNRIWRSSPPARLIADSFSIIATVGFAIGLIGATCIYAGEGNILKQVVSPALAAQRAALANQAQATQAVQALKTATQTYQASGIRGGGVMINVANNPGAVPSQVLASIHADGKVYVIDRNGIIFGGPTQINTHELTGAAMGATSNSVTELEKLQRAVTKPKENPSLIKVDVVGFGGK
jgi:filamentous hemagglutinin family protein